MLTYKDSLDMTRVQILAMMPQVMPITQGPKHLALMILMLLIQMLNLISIQTMQKAQKLTPNLIAVAKHRTIAMP